jgi:hypothetical protein
MDSCRVIVSLSTKSTMLLVSQGPDELVRAVLPPAPMIRHPRAARTVLEGLSLWLDRRLDVALYAGASSLVELNLTDALDYGEETVFYRVSVVERGADRQRGTRIRGVGDFAALRRLALLAGLR